MEERRSTMPQVFDRPEAVPDPSQPRCPFLLLIDTSGSMHGAIDEVNEGLKTFARLVKEDTLARQRIWVGVQTFGGSPQRHGDFVPALQFTPPTLTSAGGTPMGSALLDGLDWLRAKRREYRAAGSGLYTPIVILLTDGAPTDTNTDVWRQASDRLLEDESERKVVLFKLGVGSADFDFLKSLGRRAPLRITEGDIRETFVWLSDLGKSRSASNPDDALVPPQVPFGSPI